MHASASKVAAQPYLSSHAVASRAPSGRHATASTLSSSSLVCKRHSAASKDICQKAATRSRYHDGMHACMHACSAEARRREAGRRRCLAQGAGVEVCVPNTVPNTHRHTPTFTHASSVPVAGSHTRNFGAPQKEKVKNEVVRTANSPSRASGWQTHAWLAGPRVTMCVYATRRVVPAPHHALLARRSQQRSIGREVRVVDPAVRLRPSNTTATSHTDTRARSVYVMRLQAGAVEPQSPRHTGTSDCPTQAPAHTRGFHSPGWQAVLYFTFATYHPCRT